MTAWAIFLCIGSQLFLVGGQLALKHAMDEKRPKPRAVRVGWVAAGLALQAVWFFVWLSLLQNWELSRIFPFLALNPLLMVLAARLVLKERLSPESWLGVALICAGIALVSGT